MKLEPGKFYRYIRKLKPYYNKVYKCIGADTSVYGANRVIFEMEGRRYWFNPNGRIRGDGEIAWKEIKTKPVVKWL